MVLHDHAVPQDVLLGEIETVEKHLDARFAPVLVRRDDSREPIAAVDDGSEP
jgi:hypothetical protein